MRFVVLSDVHLDRTEAPASAARLIALIDRAAAIEADHVVIAGDLFDSAGARVFREGRGGKKQPALGVLRVPAAGAPTYATVAL